MKRLIEIAFVLFFVHTAEEAMFRFWETDFLSLWASNLTNIQPIWVYWMGQIALFTFLFLLLLIPRIRDSAWTRALLGIILLFEFEHPLVAFQSQHYEPGLYSGIVLSLCGLVYWKKLFQSFNSN